MLKVTRNAGDNRLQWEQIIKSITRSRKFRLRVVDTVFLGTTHETNESRPQITGWYFTTIKGEASRRKDTSNVALQHVYDRFCRLALVDANATGARIVAVGYHDSERRQINFTAEQMEREVKTYGNPFDGYSYLQCYINPCQEREQFFRGVYTSRLVQCSHRASDDGIKSDIVVYLLEDPLSIPTSDELDAKITNHLPRHLGGEQTSDVSNRIQMEIMDIMPQIVEIVETENDGNKISRISAEFILDIEGRLWLRKIDNAHFRSSEIEECEAEIHCNSGNHLLPLMLTDTRDGGSLRKSVDCRQGGDNIANDAKSHSQRGGEASREIYSGQEDDPKSARNDHDYAVKVENKILRLKEELNSKTKAKKEYSYTINALKSETKSSLKIGREEGGSKYTCSLRKHHSDSRGDLVNTLARRANRSHTGPNNPNISSELFEVVQNELKAAREENGILHNVIKDRGRHDEMITNLEKQRNDLSRQVKDEIFNKDEQRRKLEGKLKETIQDLEKSKEKIIILQTDMNNKHDYHERRFGQLKSTNKVLQAELESQKEYMDELRTTTWTELTAKVKAGVEAVTSQELAKSSIGVAQAVKDCEERWKKRLDDVNLVHTKDILTLKSEHQNKLRYQQSHLDLQVEEAQVKVEERLQGKYSESIKAMLNHKELHRQADIKSEIKRWEQMMYEMKARLNSEFQQKKQKALEASDVQWKLKLDAVSRDAVLASEEERNRSRDAMQELNNEKEAAVNLTLSKVEEQKLLAAKEAWRLAEISFQEKLKVKMREAREAWQHEMDVSSKICKEESNLSVSNAIKDEKQKVEKLRKSIDSVHLKYREEIESLKNVIKVQQRDLEKAILQRIEEERCFLQQNFEIEAEKARQSFEANVEEMKNAEEVRFENVKNDANKTIADQIASIKQESKKLMEEALNDVEIEHENQIQALEYEVGWLKNQKETAEDTIEKIRKNISERNKEMAELKKDTEYDKMCYSYHRMMMVTKALKLQSDLKSKDTAYTLKIGRMNQQHSESQRRLISKVETLNQRASNFEGNMKLISSTLLNHKREALLEHKLKSREVATKLNELSEKIHTIDTKHEKAKSCIDNLAQAMRDVEKQLQDHSQTSALQGGKINISHARKKRRLDEEYEQILNKIELKRNDLHDIEEEEHRLQIERTGANEEMRKLEKSLVEILVEQQKTLLSISTRGGGKESARK